MTTAVPSKLVARPSTVAGPTAHVAPTAATTALHSPEDCLKKAAEISAAKRKKDVVLKTQRDSATMWKAASVHPLQPLENAHQRIVYDAVLLAKTSGETDEKKLRDAASQAMSSFFVIDTGTPARLGPPDPTRRFPEEKLTDAQSHLKLIRKLMEAPKPNQKYCKAELEKVLIAAEEIHKSFPNPNAVKIATLDSIQKALSDQRTALGAATTVAALTAVATALKTALGKEEEVLGGVASVQALHFIESYYLFRLLVGYSIESDTEIAPSDPDTVSSDLTGLLNNGAGREFLRGWLRDKLVDYDAALQALDKDNIIFFLKGGRAQKYLEKKPDSGENDWDASVEINPGLPSGQWYELFVKVHNLTLEKLKGYKRELLVLLHAHGQDFMKALQADALLVTPPPPLEDENEEAAMWRAMAAIFAEDEEAASLKKYQANCKAELIDIGIPRPDTEEALEHWSRLKGSILRADDKIPHPGHAYYIDEYVTMIRETFAGVSRSSRKTPKRVRRIYDLLSMTDDKLTALIADRLKHVPSSLSKSLAAVDKLKSSNVPRYYVLVWLLQQLAEAYDLGDDPGLAAAFDGVFAGKCTADLMHGLVTIPDDFAQGIKDDGTNWKTGHLELTEAIGFGQWVSDQMKVHWSDRSAFLLKEEAKLGAFLRGIYTGSIFARNHDVKLELQMAVTGAYAGYLHGDYQNFPRRDDLPPIDRMEITLYAANPSADPETVCEIIQDAVIANLPEGYRFRAEDNGRMYLTTASDVKIGAFTYSPTVVQFAVRRGPASWPLLSYVWGHPVVSLRDLVFEYRRRCAGTEEFGAREVLRKAGAALSDMLTRYENAVASAGATAQSPGQDTTPPSTPSLPTTPATPATRVEVANVPKIAQQKSNWCWAAVSAMVRQFYGKEQVTQAGIVATFHSTLTDANNDVQGPLCLGQLRPNRAEGLVLSWDQIKAEIDRGHPFILADAEHYNVATGYVEQGANTSILYWNPLPVNQGMDLSMTYEAYRHLMLRGGASYVFP